MAIFPILVHQHPNSYVSFTLRRAHQSLCLKFKIVDLPFNGGVGLTEEPRSIKLNGVQYFNASCDKYGCWVPDIGFVLFVTAGDSLMLIP